MSQDREFRKRKTYSLRLSKFELLHLRDLFGVVLATDTKQTVSQALAVAENRTLVESRLWQRIAAACHEAELPMDEESPDFVCAAVVSAPPIGVFRLAHDPNETVSDEPKEGHKNLFGKDEEE